MLRTSVLLLLGLSLGISAKPLKPWDELANSAAEKGWQPVDKDMASLQVEPPEDMDQTSFDIEPGMKIWKAEKDLDDRQHPSTGELLKVVGPAAEGDLKVDTEVQIHLEPEEDLDELHTEEVVRKHLAPLVVRSENGPVVLMMEAQEPEPVPQKQKNLVPLVVRSENGPVVLMMEAQEPEPQPQPQRQKRLAPLMVGSENGPVVLMMEAQEPEPEPQSQKQKNLVPLVVRSENGPVVLMMGAQEPEPEPEPQPQKQKRLAPLMVGSENGPVVLMMEAQEPEPQGQRLHLEPEEDRDDIYHKDVPEMFLSETQPVAEEVSTLRRHSEPEEDLDALYHE